MTSRDIIDYLVWSAFIGDVVFLVAFVGFHPRDWYRYQMGWHLVLFTLAFAVVLGTTALRREIGPISLWATYLELGAVALVVWWRTLWMIVLKIRVYQERRQEREQAKQ